jgi:hypothetical protein
VSVKKWELLRESRKKEGVGGDEGRFFSTGGKGFLQLPRYTTNHLFCCCFVSKVVDILSSSTLYCVIDGNHNSSLFSLLLKLARPAVTM